MPTASESFPAVWTTPEDIATKTSGDWWAAHTSFCKPLHHYEGLVGFVGDGAARKLSIAGSHKRAPQQRVEYLVSRSDVVELHLGFDSVFTKWEDRSLGLAFKPLRLPLRSSSEGSGGNTVLYIVAGFNKWWRSSANAQLAQLIEAWLSEGSSGDSVAPAKQPVK